MLIARIVGRTPWSARVALDPLFANETQRDLPLSSWPGGRKRLACAGVGECGFPARGSADPSAKDLSHADCTRRR